MSTLMVSKLLLKRIFDDPCVHKGHEKDDLERLLWTMEHWAHRISPNLKFEDFLEQAEKLSRKQEITSFLRSVRAGDKDDELEIGNKNENNENDADANFEELMGLDSNALREEENLIREMSTFQVSIKPLFAVLKIKPFTSVEKRLISSKFEISDFGFSTS